MALAEYPTAEAAPRAWWPRYADDPRDSRAWASAVRWRGDGVSFVGQLPGGPFATVRSSTAVGGWSRMNAVEVCGGTFRGARPPARTLLAARTHRARQLVAAAGGYTTPVQPGECRFDPLATTALLAGLNQRARDESASFAVLHTPAGSPLVPVLHALGFEIGVTDLYPYVRVDTDDPATFMATQEHRRRHRMRRELANFARHGGRLDIRAGEAARPYLPVVAELEARASRARGGPMTPQMATEVNDRVFRSFGSAAFAVLVLDGRGEVVASSVLVLAGRRVLLRTVGLDETRARALGGYFQASFYGPLAVACAQDAQLILLGPGSLESKLRRGAQLAFTVSAVPHEHEALCELLQHTDTKLRARATAYAHTFQTVVRRDVTEACPSDS